MTSAIDLPPRLWIVGPCGAGKSTVAMRLADRLDVEPTHLDDLHWKPGWIEAEPEEEREAVAAIVARPRWVIDGNYGTLRAPHRDAVDLYVWLDLPLRTTFPRLLRRCFRRSVLGETCCNGNRESVRRTLFDRESILLWALQTGARRRQGLTRELAGRPHVRLRSPRAIDRWLNAAAPLPRS